MMRWGILAAGLLAAAGAYAQDEGPPETQCLRYLESYERSLHIPQGLTAAISLVETGRPMGPQQRLLPWPWTINVNGEGKFFATKEEALAETRKMIDEGQRSIDIGCMQINLRYHPNAFRTLDDAFDPATNVAYGAQYLVSLHEAQGSWEKAVERYHSSDEGHRTEYRDKVIALWNGDVRDLLVNAVATENTNTPWHHAMQDFAAGHYEASLSKYQELLKDNPKDRLATLGLAMSEEQLGHSAEADMAYERYIALEPDNLAVLTKLIQKAKTLPAKEAIAKLEAYAKAGVGSADLLSTISELAAKSGDNETALTYAEQAIAAAPSISTYRLNAAIAADRLKRTAVAVRYYDDFLTAIEHQPTIIAASLDGIRDRLRFLRGRL